MPENPGSTKSVITTSNSPSSAKTGGELHRVHGRSAPQSPIFHGLSDHLDDGGFIIHHQDRFLNSPATGVREVGIAGGEDALNITRNPQKSFHA